MSVFWGIDLSRRTMHQVLHQRERNINQVKCLRSPAQPKSALASVLAPPFIGRFPSVC